MMKQFVFYVLPRHTNIMTDKGFHPFDECAAKCVHLLPRMRSAPLSEGTVKCTHQGAYIANSGRFKLK